ncbi:MAG: hypothetical protein MN733_35660 [Nitrososphaera sp.]|nr:hypothetical protein [Nitrososphaera sp.]
MAKQEEAKVKVHFMPVRGGYSSKYGTFNTEGDYEVSLSTVEYLTKSFPDEFQPAGKAPESKTPEPKAAAGKKGKGGGGDDD